MGIVIAKQSFTCKIKGERFVVHKGVTRVDEEHPLNKLNPHYFEPLGLTYEVEKMTKAPGEKRKSTKKTEG